MQQNRLFLSILVLAFAILSVGAFLDSPSPTLAQSVDSTTDLSENGTISVITTTTPLPTSTGTATVTVTPTETTTATVTATATGTITATVTTTATASPTATATSTPSSRDTYLALVQRAANSPTPTATPTVTPSPTPQPECNASFDDFSNNTSGWPTGENSAIRVQYINGEYSFATRQAGIYTLRSPNSEYAVYSVEADLRWEGDLGDSYGLAYGIPADFSSYYIFDMNTEVQQYRVLRVQGQSATLVVPLTSSGAIASGNGVNRLKITVNGNTQTFEVNDTVLTTVNATHNGALDVGLVVGANGGDPTVDARFDNFCITVPQGVEGVTTKPADAPTLEMEAVTVPSFVE